jgi:asparagine synthase (glutamine-hydrolysing)
MCGIAGFVAKPGRGRSSCAPAVLHSIEHRGPDDFGWLRFHGGNTSLGREWSQPEAEPDVLLLHRRLSIIDTTQSGWQPMGTADGRYFIVFNGEIYNYKELKQELQNLGHRFYTHSDTEVLLAAYAQWGTDALRRFVGMFAFALLDTQKRSLLLVRDFFGIKPLYYSALDGFLCFGSEIKALLAFDLPQPRANAERLLSYLRQGVADFGSETLLSDIHQLPAAHYLEIAVDTCEPALPVRYWHQDAVRNADISFDEAAQRVRELFLRSVELHLRSDVPLGAALSGGIDSSAIVMAMRHLRSDAEIHCFSYIADDDALSEERWVDLVVHEAGAHVHKVKLGPSQLADDFETMMRFHDEPSGGGSVYAQYSVFRAAKGAGIKVMLDGQGADEMLGGYRHYLGARLASLVRQHRWNEARQFLKSCAGLANFSTFKSLASSADYLLPPALQIIARKLAGKDPLPQWLNGSWFAERGVGPRFRNYTTEDQVLRATLSSSMTDTLPGLLRYEDRNSMAFSVESRVPFLVPELVCFLHSLPEEFLIAPDGMSKAVFRQAMRGIVPDAILDRRDKIGYAAPEQRWLKVLDPWVREALHSEVARTIPCLNLAAAQAEWDALRSGKRPYDSRIWRCLDLIRWTGDLDVTYS